LGLGPQRGLDLRDLGGLRRLPPRACDPRLDWQPCRLAIDHRLRLHYHQLRRRQRLLPRPPLLRRASRMIHDEDDHRGLPIHSPRALQLLDACEPTGRTVYGGVVGYFDLSGQMDAAIATRTAVLPGGKAYVQSGGGVAVDSDAERQESVNKAPAAAPALSRLGVEGQDYTTGFGL